ncbi:hypothetical protein CYL31_13270 [Marinomonas sp. A3A]|uniref:hypothetical protein n=1 Tax=Marinomonas sp. A3A TaxID=2065312 RepID=UPI001BB4180D|nr:hypothetical protein [Marinomonas sp. A3A]QUX92309.1 hypothetical protein CYL31_13270 [Marinomonas sp. A3A]
MSNYGLVKTVQIDGDFEGFDDEVLFKLMDGTYWIQDQYFYWYHYSYCPRVNILRDNGRFYLQVEGQNQIVPIRQIFDVVESQINGEFKGWEGETVYELTNGQVWQQCTYNYEYTYSYMPEALIYSVGGGYKMKVEGTSADVRRVK